MSRPSNWNQLNSDQRRVWEQAERDAEYARDEIQRKADDATNKARRAERDLRAAQTELESARMFTGEEIDSLAQQVVELSMERALLIRALKQIVAEAVELTVVDIAREALKSVGEIS